MVVKIKTHSDRSEFFIGGKCVENLTAQELLNEVDKAIVNITIGGQSYKIGSRQLNRADLKVLYSMKNDLMAQIASNNGSLLDDCYVAMFDGR